MNMRSIGLVRKDCEDLLTEKRASGLNSLRDSYLTITGGTGFVGSWLAEMVMTLNEKYNFNTKICLISRNVDTFKVERPHIANHECVSLLKGDVRFCSDLPRETNWIVHAAATPDSRNHANYPIDTMNVISGGTESVLRASERLSELKNFLNLSSGLVYGEQPSEVDRIAESSLGGPKINSIFSGYAEAKRYAETLCAAFRSQTRLPVSTIRPFTFLGPYQKLTGPWALNNFIYEALNGRDIRILGDGQTVRSYMYASDMAYWILKILVGSQPGSVYNLGSPDGIELGALAKKVGQCFNSSSPIHTGVGTNKSQTPSQLVPSVQLAIESFDLEMTTSFDDALGKTIEWYRLERE